MRHLGGHGMVVLEQKYLKNGKFIMSVDFGKDENRGKTDKFKTLNHTVDSWNPWGLTDTHLAVWTVLFRHEWDGLATVSQSVIAEVLGISTKTVQRVIKQLIQKKVIGIHKKGISGINITTYRMKRIKRKSKKQKEESK